MYNREIVNQVLDKFYESYNNGETSVLLSNKFLGTLNQKERENINLWQQENLRYWDQKAWSQDDSLPLPHEIPDWDSE